jgi:hypothetical protein
MKNQISRNNPKIKQIHHLLRQRKQRVESGLFVVEGIRHVGEACAAQATVEYICYAPEMLSVILPFAGSGTVRPGNSLLSG